MTIIQEYITDRVDFARTVLETTDGTDHTIDTIIIPTDAVYNVKITIFANTDDFLQMSSFDLIALYINDGGVVTQKGSTIYSYRQRETGWLATLTIVDATVVINVTGEAAKTVSWKCERSAFIMEDEDDV